MLYPTSWCLFSSSQLAAPNPAWSWSNNSLLSRWEHRLGLLWGVTFRTQRKEESTVEWVGWWWVWNFREGCSICCHSHLPAAHLPGPGLSPYHSHCHRWHYFCWLRSPGFPCLYLPHASPNPQLTGKSSSQAIITLNNWKQEDKTRAWLW